MDTQHYEDITGFDPATLVNAAFELSSPQGMGFMHHQPGPLTTEELNRILENGKTRGISMDYVRGRAVKLHVIQDGQRSYIQKQWYDHGQHQFVELMRRLREQTPMLGSLPARIVG